MVLEAFRKKNTQKLKKTLRLSMFPPPQASGCSVGQAEPRPAEQKPPGGVLWQDHLETARKNPGGGFVNPNGATPPPSISEPETSF